jgi:hypothetical protein
LLLDGSAAPWRSRSAPARAPIKHTGIRRSDHHFVQVFRFIVCGWLGILGFWFRLIVSFGASITSNSSQLAYGDRALAVSKENNCYVIGNASDDAEEGTKLDALTGEDCEVGARNMYEIVFAAHAALYSVPA